MKNMKSLMILLSVSFFFFSFTNGEITHKTIVAGKIKSEKPLTIQKISFEFPDYLNLTTKVPAIVDSLGNFRVEIMLRHPTDFKMNFGRNLKTIMLFTSPGDSIFLEINQNILQARSVANLYSNVIVTGSSQKVNNDIAQFNLTHYQVLDWKKEEEAIFTLKPQQYESYIEKREARLTTFLKKFNKTQHTCIEFQAWANNYIKFWTWDNLTDYVWAYPRFNKLNKDSFFNALPKDYFNYLTELNNQNGEAEISSTFYNFMESLYKKNRIESSSGLNEHDPKYLDDFFARFNKSIGQLQPQYFKDILLAKFYLKVLKSDNYKNINSIYQPDLIKESTLNMQIQKLYNDKKE